MIKKSPVNSPNVSVRDTLCYPQGVAQLCVVRAADGACTCCVPCPMYVITSNGRQRMGDTGYKH